MSNMKHVFTQKWFEAVLIRMIKTFAEGCIVVIGTNAMYIGDVNWISVISGGLMGAVVSFLFALKGLPEVGDEIEDIEEE